MWSQVIEKNTKPQTPTGGPVGNSPMHISLGNESGYFSPCPGSGHSDSSIQQRGGRLCPGLLYSCGWLMLEEPLSGRFKRTKSSWSFFQVRFNAPISITLNFLHNCCLHSRAWPGAHRATWQGRKSSRPRLLPRGAGAACSLQAATLLPLLQQHPQGKTALSLLPSWDVQENQRKKPCCSPGPRKEHWADGTSSVPYSHDQPCLARGAGTRLKLLLPLFIAVCFRGKWLPYPFLPFYSSVQGYGGTDGVMRLQLLTHTRCRQSCK